MAHDDGRPPDRSAAERQADHAAIERLADDLLPALVAKLGATGLGELEVREGSWKVRLRMPERRSSRRTGPRAAGEGGMSASGGPAPDFAGSAQGPAAAGQGAAERSDAALAPGAVRRAIATSPAVGFFRPLASLSSGARIRSGDRVGAVDVLGVAHEILAPVDGRVGATLVEPGEPVEYGQEVVEIELLPNGTTDPDASPDESAAGAPSRPNEATGSPPDGRGAGPTAADVPVDLPPPGAVG